MSKPYFEVMIVDDVNEHQERWLNTNVTRMRRPEEPLIYEAVVVSSLEDALIGILFKHNIQAIVVRPGLVQKSKLMLPILKRHLAGAGDQKAIDAMQPKYYGPELCRLIARLRPEFDAYYFNNAQSIISMVFIRGSATRFYITKRIFWSCT